MIGLLRFILAILVSPFRAKARLEAENAALRQQVIILHRKNRGRIRLTNADRCFFVQLYRFFPSILQVFISSGLRYWSAGIELGFAAIGDGSLGEGEGGRKLRRTYARSFVR